MQNKLEYSADLAAQASNYYHAGDYVKAARLSQKAFKYDPQNISALTNLGNLCFLQNDYQNAMEYYARIYKLNPSYILNLLNLANTCFELKDYDQCCKFSLQVLAKEENHKMALSLLGNSYLAQEKLQESLAVFEHLLKVDPQDIWTRNSLSQAYQKIGSYDLAFEHAWQGVVLSGGEDSQQLNLGYLLYEISLENGVENIRNRVQKWRLAFPENPVVNYMSCALENDPKVQMADPDYLRRVFDNFAEGFENILAGLDYQAPQLIESFLEAIYGLRKSPRLRILDAGCGTGLCGKFLKKYACWRGLDGVDISSQMLAQAADKKLYSRLYCQDLVDFLDHKQERYNLICAADVFTYFGELDSLFSALYKSLCPKGRIIFTATKNDANNNDWFLHCSGRFQHHQTYLRQVLEKQGFLLEKLQDEILRTEGGEPVWGYVVVAVKTV